MSYPTIEEKWRSWEKLFLTIKEKELLLLYLIDRGRELSGLPLDGYNHKNLVDGCMSRLWLVVEEREGHLYLQGSSDSLILKGLLALLIDLFSGRPALDILSFPLNFWEKSSLAELISSRRLIGFQSLLEKIYQKATALMSEGS